MPKGNVDGTCEKVDQDTPKVPFHLLSSISQRIDQNKSLDDATTSNANDNVKRNVPFHPRIDLQRRPVHLEGYRKICFDGIPGFPNAIP